MKDYNHIAIEKKWQAIWDEKETFRTGTDRSRPQYYALIEFPYPSGKGLHVGHPRPYTALDIVARKRRLEGFNVLFPMGWDAFGLPTENYAIKNKLHPADVTRDNVVHFKKQAKSIGFSFDWSREINTTDPKYFKWTQWIFLQLFKHGLAYKKEMSINFCTSCKVGLANEEVVNGACERCGSEVTRKLKSQWMLKITEYAERLIDDLKLVDYPERVRATQINWIGRSEGAEVDFKIAGTDDVLRVYTTRPDTLYGATYMVMSPEHPYLQKYKDRIKNYEEIMEYERVASHKSDMERTELAKDKTGLEVSGLKAINPVNDELIPIWVSDYVLMSYGTGAIMAVPAHDQRDYEFAKKFNLPIVEVVGGGDISESAFTDIETGIMVNSGIIDGLNVKDGKKKITEHLTEKGIGEFKINYKLRDWVFSRQRYWGEPIPLVYCEDCGWVAIPEDELPLELPEVEHYEPTDTGESPLANITDWVNTTCPDCGKPAKRETDTMPQWAGSSWYYLRYIDVDNDEELASKDLLEYWTPVDWYNGGMEHTTLHLLYSRFWHKFLYDIGAVPTPEPYKKRTSHGMILASNGEKMSKSQGEVINPDDVIAESGADTLRMFEMFIGDFEKSVPWSENGVKGCKRFLDRVFRMTSMVNDIKGYSKDMEIAMHKTIKKVSHDFETLKFNTGIAALMTLANDFYHKGSITVDEFRTFLILLNPVSPHITEELWVQQGYEGMLNQASWPEYDEDKTVEETIEIVVQVNGKIRHKMMIAADLDRDAMQKAAMEDSNVKALVKGKNVVKVIAIPGRLVNIVVR